MEQLATTATNVLVLSSIYILVALGFAFLFNMLGILNLAHGAIYMVGGYIGFALAIVFGINVWLALVLTTVIMGAFGTVLERLCFRPFAGDFNRTVMICVAITIALQTAVNIIAGTKTLALPPFVEGGLHIGIVYVSYERMVTFAIGAILLLGTMWFVNRTKWGQQMQAVSQDAEAAVLAGNQRWHCFQHSLGHWLRVGCNSGMSRRRLSELGAFHGRRDAGKGAHVSHPRGCGKHKRFVYHGVRSGHHRRHSTGSDERGNK